MKPALLCFFSLCLALTSRTLFADQKDWTIGVMVCLSGECAESGSNSMKGIELAVEEINKTGGVLGRKLVIKAEDTDEGKSSGVGAVTAFRKLIEDPEIKFIVGPSWTPGGLSVAPLAAKRPDVIVTSPSLGVADFNEAGDNIFNLWPHDRYATRFLADFAYKKGWKKVAIFSSQQPWEHLQGNTFAEEFKELGGDVAVKLDPLPTVADLRSECLRIRAAQPDAVFLSNYTQMGVAAKQLRLVGYQGPFFAILMSDSRVKIAKGALEGAVYAGYPEPASQFASSFKERFSESPGIGADTSYDTVKLYADAVKAAGSLSVDTVKAQLLKMKLEGASGTIEFDEFGGVRKDPVLYQIVGNQMIRYSGEVGSDKKAG